MDQPTSFNDLTVDIILDILARLSVKSIFVCRSLCKLLHSILLSSDFANLHFSRASTSVLHVEPNSRDTTYTALHLVEFERDHHCRLCGNNYNSSRQCPASQKYKDHVDMKLGARFMLPFLKSRTHSSTSVVNSCNGLLLLHSSLSDLPVSTDLAMKTDDVVGIYNPVTGEYSIIPLPKFTTKRSIRVLGLGFSRQTDQYKVLIRVRKWTTGNNDGNRPTSSVYLIFTIGSGLWRSIENEPEECDRLFSNPPVFVNSSLHWLVVRFPIHESLTCFNFNDEKFHMLPLPPPPPLVKETLDSSDRDSELAYFVCVVMHRFERSIGVLRDHLILCDISSRCPSSNSLWVMRNDGIKEFWVQEQFLASFPSYSRPIDYLKSMDMLMYRSNPYALNFYDGSSLNFTKSVLHVPSFLSLQEIVGDNAEVMRVTSESYIKATKF